MQRNELLCKLFTGVSPKLENLINIVDKYGRNAFTALFWDISDHSLLPEKMQRWANMLLEQGLSSDALCCYPIQVHHFPTVKYIRCHVQLKDSTPKYPPLISAVVVKNYVLVQWLLTRGETTNFTVVDVNVKDREGRTALMHAVRANDIKMVKLLLYPKYDHGKDLNPWEGVSGFHKIWTEWQNKRASNKISFEVQDKKGWNVTDYLVAANDNYYYLNASTILQLLGQDLPIQEASGDGTSPLEKAVKMNRVHLVEYFEDFLKVDKSKRIKFSTDFQDLFETDFKDAENLAVITDFEKDCKKMTEILVAKEEEDAKAKLDAAKESPTDLDPVLKADNEKFMYTIIMDENENIPYSCSLTFVDLSYGEYGLYNFYKMQLVQQGRGNKLILLFTRWGRVGDTGQYQKTPYPSVDEAIKEFQKIFRSKTGNAWKDFKRFTPIENKYRLNDEDKSVKAAVEVKIDFSKLSDASEHKKSILPPEIHHLVRNISLVHSSEKFHKEISPHNITFQDYKKGDDILDKIAKLIEAYDASKAAASKVSETDSAKTEFPPEEEINFKKVVQKLSEEFFATCPFKNFSKTKIEVLSSKDVLRYRKEIHGFVHLDLASQVFLGSLHNLPIMNPFEYIYRCLNIKMSRIEKNQQESQFILEYIKNSDSNVKVRNIFRLRRSGEKENFESSGVGNPWLLWHGTANVNMLSILHRGLQIAPLETNWNGHLFGRGIYFADSFAKSSRYTRGNDKLYIFLCEVALGKIYPVTLPSAAEATTSQANIISSYNSFKTSDSRWEPDPASTIIWNGRTVPLGRPIERVQLDNSYHRGLENNEYIVFNKNQVNLRYLIEFTT